MTKMSDRRSKEDVVQIGILPMGIGCYLFDYKPQCRGLTAHGRQLGVMADEVEKFIPEAVGIHASGYKTVNYAMLDITPADMVVAFSD